MMPAIQEAGNDPKKRNDMIAFIILSLGEIEKTVNDTIAPWEKRGYWTKAEHFTREWLWVKAIKDQLIQSEKPDGWKDWPEALNHLFVKLASIKPTRKKLDGFWEGSYNLYKKQKANLK